jgi:hypothetical protein
MVQYRSMFTHAVRAESVAPAEKPMDMRTISQLLEDERTLALMLPPSRYSLQLDAMASLRTHFQPAAATANLFIYKATTQEEMSLTAAHCPQTADDFYALAMAIKQQHAYTIHGEFSLSRYDNLATPDVLKAFAYNLLADAAKAGHALAKNVLIDDTLKGDAAARKHVTFFFKEYTIGGCVIKLPRQPKSSEEFRKLGSDLLIQFRRHLCVDGQPLLGAYYELADGKNAEKLAQYLIKQAKSRLQEEAKAHADRKYDEQHLRSAGANGLFGTLVEADTRSTPTLVGDTLCLAPAR